MNIYLGLKNDVRCHGLALIQYSIWIGLGYLVSSRMFAHCIDCPSYLWFKVEERCYTVSAEVATWNRGKVYCRERGLHLARFDNFTASMELVKNSSIMRDLFSVNDSIWIGVNDIKNEGEYVWDDNNKAIGEDLPWEVKPSADHQDCVLLTRRLTLLESNCTDSARTWCMAFDISNEKQSFFIVPASYKLTAGFIFEYLLTTFSTIPLEVNMSLHAIDRFISSKIFLIYYKRHVRYVLAETFDSAYDDVIKVVPCYVFVAQGVYSLHVFKHERFGSVASFIALPLSVWGNKYFLVTLNSKPMIDIVAFEHLSVALRIAVTPVNTYFYLNKRKLNHGDIVTQQLQRYQGFTIRFCSEGHRVKSFTGTEVTSTKPIGVVSGNCVDDFSNDPMKTSKDSSYEMLLPAKFYGDDFFIVSLISRITPMVTFVTAGEEDTSVDVFLGTAIKRFIIARQGECIRLNETSQPFRITSSKGVQVLYVQTSCCKSDNDYTGAGDPSLCIIVPTVLFHFKYMFVPSSGMFSNAILRNYVIIVARKSTTALIRLNKSFMKIQGQWDSILGDLKWKTGTAILETAYLYTVSSTNFDYFGCYFLGIETLRSYMMPGGYCNGADKICRTLRQMPKFCHCKNKMCEWNGECKTNFDCIPGWFGAGCQYRDLANSSWLEKVLIDNNASTCLGHQIKTSSVMLKDAITFTWARLVFSSRAAENQITSVKLHKEGTFLGCDQFRYVESHRRSFDVFCKSTDHINKIIFDWKGTGALCSIHVYGGRNLASIGSISYSHGDPIDRATTMVSDGITTEEKCSPLREDDLNSMYMHFQSPVTASTMAFYIAQNSSSLTRFKVQFLDTENQMVGEVITFVKRRTNIISTFNQKHTFKLLTLVVDAGDMELCEIEVLGDCLDCMHGWDCDRTCPDSCLNQTCNFDGICHQCSMGLTGKLCDRGTTLKSNFTTVAMGMEITMEVNTTVPADSCKKGYSGKYCESICKCSDRVCSRRGECRNNATCAEGWFAVQCQYSDLSVEAVVNNPILIDGNDMSCSSQKIFSATFPIPYLYSWMRIVFEPGAKVSDFLLIVSMTTGNRTSDVKCDALRVTKDGPNTFDVFCHLVPYTKNIVLSWEGTGRVCSVYINGGRVLFPHTRISHEEGTDRTEVRSVDDFLTDGDISTKKCITIDAAVSDRLTFTFLQKYIINSIRIFTDLTEGQGRSFSLLVTFDQSVAGYGYKSPGGHKHTIFSGNTSIVATTVSIAIDKSSIGICEIEIFGDCHPPYYSLDCNLKCASTCLNEICVHNGICHECRGNGTGQFCTAVNAALKVTHPNERLKKQEVVTLLQYLFLVPPIFGIFVALTFIVRNRQFNTYGKEHAEEEDHSN